MNAINAQDLLDEIRYDIKMRDLRKAQIVLEALEHVNWVTQKQALFEVSRADEEFSIPLLTGIFIKSPNIAESFPHIKETMFSKILSSPDTLLDLLAKAKDSKSRALLAELAGEIRLEKAGPLLMEILGQETDFHTLEAIILALGVIGYQSGAKAIQEYLYSAEQKITVATVRALGELATREAVDYLAAKLGQDEYLDLLIITVLGRIQSPEAIDKLNETLSSEHAHIRTAGKKKLSEIGSVSFRVLLKNLPRKNSDLVIHSLNVLGDIGDSAAIPGIRKLLISDPEDANVRFAAYETLGRLSIEKGAVALAAGLEDPVENVRAAAAKAIEHNYNAVLAGGLRNLIESGDDDAKRITETVVDAQCEKIFMDLVDVDCFKAAAINYLSKKAHPDIRMYYVELLSRVGHQALAKQVIMLEKASMSKKRVKVFAVDDSKMILNIYRTFLHNLGCESFTFEFPASALAHLDKERPDVMLTDLNMPDITGIDLTETVRKKYDKHELPIIMVTTQSEGKDTKDAYASGVNGVIHKPFTEEQIRSSLKQYTVFKPDE